VIPNPLRRWLNNREAKRANRAGLLAMQAGDYERAEMLFRAAVTLQPEAWGAWLNLGNSVGNRGRYREALRHYHHAHTLAPLEHSPRVNAAYAHLTLGESREGWALYEERWRDEGLRERTTVAAGLFRERASLTSGNRVRYTATGLTEDETRRKRWDGRARPGESLLVFTEQGLGDLVMALRYHRELMALGMSVIYRVPAPLYRTTRYNCRGAQVVMTTDPLPEHRWHCPSLSLPFLLGVREPGDVCGKAYLSAPKDTAIAALSGYKVGFVWSGNPSHPNDSRRSIDITTMAPLFGLPGVTGVSLQVGAKAGEADQYSLYRPPLQDFEDTCRVLAALDLVVAVDTSCAHVAGAMGVPTLVLLPNGPDWRWGASGERTVWYDSTVLLRQTHAGLWSAPVRRARDEIVKRIESAGSAVA
jgi:hypothetical protein